MDVLTLKGVNVLIYLNCVNLRTCLKSQSRLAMVAINRTVDSAIASIRLTLGNSEDYAPGNYRIKEENGNIAFLLHQKLLIKCKLCIW